MTATTAWLVAIGAGGVTLALRWLPLLLPRAVFETSGRGRQFLDHASYAILGGIVSMTALSAGRRLTPEGSLGAALTLAAVGLSFTLAARGRSSLLAALAGVGVYLIGALLLKP